MKTCIAGDGSNSTAAVLAWLASHREIPLAHLYLIGEADHPQALFLTDFESPLAWPVVGTFEPTVIKRGGVMQKIGFDVESLDVTWSPINTTPGRTIGTATPYQLARMGYYDNWPIRVWTCFMPTPGDAYTFGAAELWGGRVAKVTVGRGSLQFKVNSFLDIVNQQVPTNVIDVLNTEAPYRGATPPQGFVNVPRFIVVPGSSTNVVVGYQTFPNPGSILDDNIVRGGFLVFEHNPADPNANPPVVGSSLDGMWGGIRQNSAVNTGGSAPGANGFGGGGGQYNQFQLYSPLPWPPKDGDTFYVSGASPVNKADGDYYGFPFVPNPEAAL